MRGCVRSCWKTHRLEDGVGLITPPFAVEGSPLHHEEHPVTTCGLVDPELPPLLEVFPDFDFSLQNLAPICEQFSSRMGASAAEDGVAVAECHIPGSETGDLLWLLVCTPPRAVASGPTLLHLHGGGCVIGAPEMDAQLNRALC